MCECTNLFWFLKGMETTFHRNFQAKDNLKNMIDQQCTLMLKKEMFYQRLCNYMKRSMEFKYFCLIHPNFEVTTIDTLSRTQQRYTTEQVTASLN